MEPVRYSKASEASLQLEAVIKTATDGIIIIDQRGTMEMVNEAAAGLFGYAEKEMIGQNVSMLMPPPDKTNHDNYLKKYHQTGQAKIIGIGREVHGRRKNGTTFPLRLSISEVKLPDRIIFTGILHDLTREKEAEQALHDEKERTRTYFDMANTINVVMDRQCRIIEINKKGCAFLGKKTSDEDTLRGQPWFDLIVPDASRVAIRETYLKMMSEDIPVLDSLECIVTRSDGQIRDFAWKNSLLRDDRQMVIGLIASGIDITERKVAERALQKEKERAQRYLDVANTLFVAIDLADKITLLNRKGTELLGYTESEAIGKNWYELVAVATENQASFKEFIRNAGPQKGYFESLIKPKSGEQKLIAWRVAQVHDDSGKIHAYLLSGVDITEQREAEKRIQEMNAQLEQRVEERTEELASAVNQLLNINKKMEFEIKERKVAEEALRKNQKELRKAYEKEKELSTLKSRFVSMASHEFRTPLSTILSSADLIEAYQKEEQQNKRERHTTRIKSAVSNLTGILNDFLSLSRLEEGAIHLTPSSFDLNAFCEEAIEELNGILKPGQYITIQASQPHIDVYLDKKMMKNILYNLLSNASKYSPPEKPIELTISQSNNQIRVEIKDYGIGIPEEEQQHLFSRFFRAHNVENIQGTGLGLNIVKRYVELMGGSITFESSLGTGTTFAVRLPKQQKT